MEIRARRLDLFFRAKELFSNRALSENPYGSMLKVSILLVELCSGAICALGDLPLKIDLNRLPRRLCGEQFFCD